MWDIVGLALAKKRRCKSVAPKRRSKEPTFDALAFLETIGAPSVAYARSAVIFAQGDSGENVLFIRSGAVRISVLSHTGKEAIVALLEAGDFVGEGALAGQSVRMGTATAVVATSMLVIPKRQMVDLFHQEPEFSNRFIQYMLSRNIRVEEDLVDQLFNSS